MERKHIVEQHRYNYRDAKNYEEIQRIRWRYKLRALLLAAIVAGVVGIILALSKWIG